MRLLSISMLIISLGLLGCKSTEKQPSCGDCTDVIPQNPISVGSAEVVFEALELGENQISARVVEVLGYGASTPSLSPDQVVTLTFNDTLAPALAGLSSGDMFSAVISKTRAGVDMEENANLWNISELITNRGE